MLALPPHFVIDNFLAQDNMLALPPHFIIDNFLAHDNIGASWVHAGRNDNNAGLSLQSLQSVDLILHIAQHSNRSTDLKDVYFVVGSADLAQRDDTVVRDSTSVADLLSWEGDEQPPDCLVGVHRRPIVPAETIAAII